MSSELDTFLGALQEVAPTPKEAKNVADEFLLNVEAEKYTPPKVSKLGKSGVFVGGLFRNLAGGIQTFAELGGMSAPIRADEIPFRQKKGDLELAYRAAEFKGDLAKLEEIRPQLQAASTALSEKTQRYGNRGLFEEIIYATTGGKKLDELVEYASEASSLWDSPHGFTDALANNLAIHGGRALSVAVNAPAGIAGFVRSEAAETQDIFNDYSVANGIPLDSKKTAPYLLGATAASSYAEYLENTLITASVKGKIVERITRKSLTAIAQGPLKQRLALYLASQAYYSSVSALEEGAQTAIKLASLNFYIFNENEDRKQQGLKPLPYLDAASIKEQVVDDTIAGLSAGVSFGAVGLAGSGAKEYSRHRAIARAKVREEVAEKQFQDLPKVKDAIETAIPEAERKTKQLYRDYYNQLPEEELFIRVRELQESFASDRPGESLPKVDDYPGATPVARAIEMLIENQELDAEWIARYHQAIVEEIQKIPDMGAFDKLMVQLKYTTSTSAEALMAFRKTLEESVNNLKTEEGAPRFTSLDEFAETIHMEGVKEGKGLKLLQELAVEYGGQTLEQAFLDNFATRHAYAQMPVTVGLGLFNLQEEGAANQYEAFQKAVYRTTQQLQSLISQRIAEKNGTVAQEDVDTIQRLINKNNPVEDVGSMELNGLPLDTTNPAQLSTYQKLIENLVHAVISTSERLSVQDRFLALRYVENALGRDFVGMIEKLGEYMPDIVPSMSTKGLLGQLLQDVEMQLLSTTDPQERARLEERRAYYQERYKKTRGTPFVFAQDVRIGPQEFFSPLAQIVSSLKQETFTPEQLKQQVKKLPGYREEEVDDLGFDAWLDGLNRKVTKEEVLQFIADKGPQLYERSHEDIRSEMPYYVKGVRGDIRYFKTQEEAEAYETELQAELDKSVEVDYDRDPDTGITTVTLRDVTKDVTLIQFSYSREKERCQVTDYYLSTHLGSDAVDIARLQLDKHGREVELSVFLSVFANLRSEYQKATYGAITLGNTLPRQTLQYRGYATAGTNYREFLLQLPTMFPMYEHRHWKEKNVLTFGRTTDKQGPNGSTLYVEEIQSDLHQEAKSLRDARIADLVKDGMDEALAKAIVPMNYGTGPATGIPDAPFKKSWRMLMFKRLLGKAIAEGYDTIAWTPGAEQLERYVDALQQAVDRIEWTKTTKGVQLKGYRGKKVVVDTIEKENALSDAIGKAMGDNILQDSNQSGVLEGDDITISDTGMMGFYDEILVNDVKKYVKKLGGQVRRVKHDGLITDALSWEVILTPEMKETLSKGQPLYQTGRVLKSGATVVQGSVSFLENNQVSLQFFKGANLSTILHEFTHILHRYLDPKNIADSMASYLETQFKGLSDEALQKQYDRLEGLWNMWQEDPLNPLLHKPDSASLLRGYMEHVARQYEKFVFKGEAPSKALSVAFRIIKKEMADIYEKVSAIPDIRADIDPTIRNIFDRLLAGKRALSAPTPKKININGRAYTVYTNRPRDEFGKTILKKVREGYLKLDGITAELQKYALDSLGAKAVKKDGELRRRIETADSYAAAKNVIDYVDTLLWKQQKKEHDKIVKEIQQMVRAVEWKKIPKALSDNIKEEIEGIDFNRLTGGKLRSLKGMQQWIISNIRSGNVTPDMLAIPLSKLKQLERLSQKNIYDFEIDELLTLRGALTFIIKEGEQQQFLRLKKKFMIYSRAHSELKASLAHLTPKDRYSGLDTNPKLRSDDQLRTKLLHGLKYALAVGGRQEARLLEYIAEFDKNHPIYRFVTYIRDGYNIIDNRTVEDKRFMHALYREIGPVIQQWSIAFQHGAEKLEDKYIKTYSTTDSLGRKVDLKLTMGEMMTLFMYSMNDYARAHLLGKGIGRVGARKQNIYYQISPELLADIIADIDPAAKQAAYMMLEYYESVVKPAINDVSLRLLGYEIANEPNYFPLFVWGQTRGQQEVLNKPALSMNMQQFQHQFLDRLGFLQARTGSTSPIYIYDAFEAMSHNLTDVNRYVGLAEPLNYIKAVFRDQDDARGVYNTIARSWGPDAVESIDRWIDRIEDESVAHKVGDNVLRRFKTAAVMAQLGANLFVALYNRLSWVLARNYDISMPAMAKAFAKNHRPGTAFGVVANNSMEDLAREFPELHSRFEMGPNVDINEVYQQNLTRYQWLGHIQGREAVARIHDWPTFRTAVKTLSTTSAMKLMKTNDAFCLSLIWDAVQEEGAVQGWSSKEMRERFLEIYYNTQSQYQTVNLSPMMGEKDPLWRIAFVTYQSMPNQLWNELEYHIRKWGVEQKKLTSAKEKFKSTAKMLERVLMITVTQNLLINMLREVKNIRSEDDDDPVLDYISRVVRGVIRDAIGIIPYFGGLVSGTVEAISDPRNRYNAFDTPGSFASQLVTGAAATAITIGEDVKEEDWGVASYHALRLVTKCLSISHGFAWDSVIGQAESAVEVAIGESI